MYLISDVHDTAQENFGAQFVDVININNDHVYNVNNNKFGV